MKAYLNRRYSDDLRCGPYQAINKVLKFSTLNDALEGDTSKAILSPGNKLKVVYCGLMVEGGAHTEEELLKRFRQGDNAAFTELFKRLHQRLFFFAQRFVTQADAKDVVSEAFAQLWQKREDFERVAAITQFLFVTVRNKCLNLLRNETLRQKKLGHILHTLEQSEEPELLREDVLTGLVSLIYQEMEQLPPRMKEIFLLSFRDGMKPAEIAEQLGIGVQTVKNKKLAAIKLLQAAIERGTGRALLLMINVANFME